MSLLRSLVTRPAAAAVTASVALALLLAPASAPRAADAPAAQAPAAVKKLDVNTATEAQLLELPKIGPATAKRILEYRKQVGTIKSVDELINVKGIGEKTLELLRPYVTVSAPAGSKS